MDRFTERSVTFVPVQAPSEKIQRMGIHYFMGSCFAENLYKYYKDRFVDCAFSPFGNIYNPLSLARSIKLLCSETPVDEKDFFEHRELWRHYDFDTEMCSTFKEEYIERINHALDQGRKMIQENSYLYLTLGTSYVYRLKKTGQVVNNCHKLPSSDFTRSCASIIEMKEAMNEAIEQLKKKNPSVNIVLTLSPVRHLRDNPVENSLSKARLRCLIEELGDCFDYWYFPAYEILLDQLRDYRWFGRDMAHPSEQAVEYIMERFVQDGIDSDFQNYLEQTGKLRSRLNHRLLHPETIEAGKFQKGTQELFKKLKKQYPNMLALNEAEL